MKNQLTIFDFLNGMTLEKLDYDFDNPEVNNSYSQYMINRFVSMSQYSLPIVKELVLRRNIPNEQHYEFLKQLLPEKKVYFDYVKKSKDLYTDRDFLVLAKYFEVGINDVREMINILSEDEINEIISLYKKELDDS